MDITDVRVKLCGENSEQLKAFCSITLDSHFVVRDLKVIEGSSGLFVAMPSRKLSDRCIKCRHKNHLRARFCNECGAKLRDNRSARGGVGRSKLYVDVAHPINSDCRKLVQETVVEAYKQEVERSHEPDYIPQDYDEEEVIVEAEAAEEPEEVEAPEETDETEVLETTEVVNEYDDLIRHLKNDAMTRRSGSDPISPSDARPEVDYTFAEDDQDLAVEQPRAQAPRPAAPAPRRDQGRSSGRDNPRPPQGQRSGGGGQQNYRRSDQDRDRDRPPRRDMPPRDSGPRRDMPQRGDAPQRGEAPHRDESRQRSFAPPRDESPQRSFGPPPDESPQRAEPPARREAPPRPAPAPPRRPDPVPVQAAPAPVQAPKPPPPPPAPAAENDDFGAGLL